MNSWGPCDHQPTAHPRGQPRHPQNGGTTAPKTSTAAKASSGHDVTPRPLPPPTPPPFAPSLRHDQPMGGGTGGGRGAVESHRSAPASAPVVPQRARAGRCRRRPQPAAPSGRAAGLCCGRACPGGRGAGRAWGGRCGGGWAGGGSRAGGCGRRGLNRVFSPQIAFRRA